jgi:hypothetical protein
MITVRRSHHARHIRLICTGELLPVTVTLPKMDDDDEEEDEMQVEKPVESEVKKGKRKAQD